MQVHGVAESPHLYGRGLDLNPAGRVACDSGDYSGETEYARKMKILFNATPSPKLLEAGATILDPTDSTDSDNDGVPDVFDVCMDGADHVHVGSGN